MDFPAEAIGLTSKEAAARLARDGPNVITAPRTRSLFHIALTTLREPMFLLLLAAALLYLLVGDLAEGIFLSAGALLSLGLVIAQEARSERALQALNALAEPRARVMRDGAPITIPATQLVAGDLLILGEGNRIPADALLVEGDALEVDESALTGESVSATKTPLAVGAVASGQARQSGNPASSLFAATVIVRGQGVAKVVRTGSATEVGRIGQGLAGIIEAPTLLQRDVRRLIQRLGIVALAFCLLVAAAYGLLRGDWFGGALGGLTLAISLIPEEFPMVLTIFMALGALRLAKRNVLVRRSAVIETLGATTLLCVDKTGTLTENRMTLRCVWRGGQRHDLRVDNGPEATRVLATAQMASALRPHDPIDSAVHDALPAEPRGEALRSYPLRPEFLAFVQVWQVGERFVYAAKGAHEAVLALCNGDAALQRDARAAAQELGASGLRVLAVARAEFASDPGLSPQAIDYEFEGLLGFEDPVRADVPASLREAVDAGVSVAMITGDSPATALATARTAGLSIEGGVMTGEDLATGAPVPAKAMVFARIKPQQKLDLIQQFRQRNHVVAMTGDGINDAPALAAADIGIAMGQRGTDVAREAADLILLDDHFSSIIGGIALGRRIFANLRRAMTYITAIHIPVAGLALLPILLGLPAMLYPMHLVLLELLIDPLCSVVFELQPSERDAMSKPPRDVDEALFGRRHLITAAVQGLVILIAVLALYIWLVGSGTSAGAARAAAFVALVVSHLSLALTESSAGREHRRGGPGAVFWSIAGGAAVVLTTALNLPWLRDVLRFETPAAQVVALSSIVGLVAGAWWRLVPALGTATSTQFAIDRVDPLARDG